MRPRVEGRRGRRKYASSSSGYGQCEACNVSGAEGLCSAVTGAPRTGHTPCAGDPAVCGGTCDGVNRAACAYAPSTKVCGGACLAGVETPSTCDGVGACAVASPKTCGSYACDAAGKACEKSCTSDTQCAAGFVCTLGACVPASSAKLGDSCTSASTCPKGAYCTDGVCCTDAICAAGLACDTPKKKGTCAKPAGADCKANADCGTGICADGVCCDRACDGQCEACDVTGRVGTCTAVKGAPRGVRAPCATDATNVCASASCDGTDTTKCAGKPGAETICRKPACTAGAATTGSRCDGKGSCVDEAPVPCSPYRCDSKGEACQTSCTAASDCADGFTCDGGKCVGVVTTSRCSDDGLSVIDPKGKVSDCAGRLCKGGKCIEVCNSTDDCAPGYLCSSGTCVPPAASTDEGGGCTVSPHTRRSTGTAGEGMAIGGALLTLALRRRRGARGRA